MKTETKEDRALRKVIFMARATKHIDTTEIRKEAEELFEKSNKE